MNKDQVDRLYHYLRVASNITSRSPTMVADGRPISLETGLTPQEEVSVLYGLCQHLLAGGDYPALIRFSQYYGLRFLLEPTYHAIQRAGWKPARIVELGAGLGWLGRALASKLGFLPALFVDKRPWPLTDVVADLEAEAGRSTVLEELKEGDLIVAADLLHCLDSPMEVMEPFSRWPMAILEYCPTDDEYAESYSVQVERYGAKSILPQAFEVMFPGRKLDIVDLDPYIILLVEVKND